MDRGAGDPALTSLDRERWAEALAIEKWKGEGAAAYVAERIGALALAGDTAGVERFRAIAVKLDVLQQCGQVGGKPRVRTC